jgi:translation initiation factor IF-3
LMFTRDAIALARQRGLDLVEIAPNEMPPVCKMMDYGKFRYEQTKKDRDSRKSQKQVVIKEVRFSPKIDDHDVQTKAKMVRRFLDEGNKVKLTVKFKGRELAHPNLGRDVLEQVRMMLGDNLVVEAPPKMEGKNMTMIVSLKPPKGGVKPPKPAAEAQKVVSPPSPSNGNGQATPDTAPATVPQEPVAVASGTNAPE